MSSRARSIAFALAGRFTRYDPATGKVVDGEQVSVGSGPFRSSRAGLAQTNAAGRFAISGRLGAHRIVRFRAHATADRRDLSKPPCGKDGNGVPCVHELLAIWEKDSKVVAIRP